MHEPSRDARVHAANIRRIAQQDSFGARGRTTNQTHWETLDRAMGKAFGGYHREQDF